MKCSTGNRIGNQCLIFSEDKISFYKDYWTQILKAYPANDRTYQGEHNALFLTLRTSFQILAQLRLMRTQVQPKLGTLEERIENIHTLLNSLAQKEPLVTLYTNYHLFLLWYASLFCELLTSLNFHPLKFEFYPKFYSLAGRNEKCNHSV